MVESSSSAGEKPPFLAEIMLQSQLLPLKSPCLIRLMLKPTIFAG